MAAVLPPARAAGRRLQQATLANRFLTRPCLHPVETAVGVSSEALEWNSFVELGTGTVVELASNG